MLKNFLCIQRNIWVDKIIDYHWVIELRIIKNFLLNSLHFLNIENLYNEHYYFYNQENTYKNKFIAFSYQFYILSKISTHVQTSSGFPLLNSL